MHCNALNILAHTFLVSALRVFLFLRERHVFLTLLHSSWLIHELVFCCWLAVWVQSHPCSCHTKRWQRSNHVYLSVPGATGLTSFIPAISSVSVCCNGACLAYPQRDSSTVDPSKAPCGYLIGLRIVPLWFLIGTSMRLGVV